MKKFIFTGLLISFIQTSFATEATLTGQGQLLASPNYIELSLQITSQCYSTPNEARQANDAIARKIIDFLNLKNTGTGYYNKVISLGGYTLPYQSYDSSGQNRLLCHNTFQKQTTVTFRTEQVTTFEKLYNDIQNEVYKNFVIQPKTNIEAAISYVTLQTPNPLLSTEGRSALEMQAMSLATTNALNKLYRLFDKNKIKQLKIIRISELPPEERPIETPRTMKLMSARAEQSNSAPIQFDNEWITKTIYITFSFDDIYP